MAGRPSQPGERSKCELRVAHRHAGALVAEAGVPTHDGALVAVAVMVPIDQRVAGLNRSAKPRVR